jgi:hypothetical protein
VFYCICDCLSFSDPTIVAIGLSDCNCVTRKFKIPTVPRSSHSHKVCDSNRVLIPYHDKWKLNTKKTKITRESSSYCID